MYYKLILLNITPYETTIEDERHFSSRSAAEEYSRTKPTLFPVLITMEY